MRAFRSLFLAAAASSLAACAHNPKPVEPPAPAVTEPAPAPEPAPVVAAPAPAPERAPAPAEVSPASVYFEYDSSDLSEATRAALQAMNDQVRQRPDVSVRVEGNCDERGTTEYNLHLGQRRADAARAYLVNLGLDPSRVSTVSYGKERPRAAGHDESAWRENRRDDLMTTTTVASSTTP